MKFVALKGYKNAGPRLSIEKPVLLDFVNVFSILCSRLQQFLFIILYKILIITGISHKTRNELTIYAILCRNVKMFHRQELASLGKIWKTWKNSK